MAGDLPRPWENMGEYEKESEKAEQEFGDDPKVQEYQRIHAQYDQSYGRVFMDRDYMKDLIGKEEGAELAVEDYDLIIKQLQELVTIKTDSLNLSQEQKRAARLIYGLPV